jgi:outer membrane protein OmpA-like peptidoglycan-associated protein
MFKAFLSKNGDYYLNPKMDKIKLVKIQLNPIYFDLDKSYIRKDAAVELDKIVKLLTDYPSIELSMESHTDCRDTDEHNNELSERRANSTMQYLIDHGIDAGRLKAKGFGETRPVNHCIDGVKCSGKEHQMNRRTEFMIIKM